VSGLTKAFDPGTVLLAKHAQHVVLVHFPIALFITGVILAWAGRWTRRGSLAEAGYYNLMIAAVSTLPVVATGLLAWQLQLEGERLKGLLLWHLVLGCLSSLLICTVWWLHSRARRSGAKAPRYLALIEVVGLLTVGLTGHLGGFVSGVSGG
jgi:uncharacterized membrane protein